MMMNLNSDLLYNGDVKIKDLVTTGWTSGSAFGGKLKQTEEVYKSTTPVDNTRDDGDVKIFVGKTYDFAYSATPGKEATAFDPDFITYVGGAAVEGKTDDYVKYIGGYPYKFVGENEIKINDIALKAQVYAVVTEDAKYLEASHVAVYNGETYIETTEGVYTASELPLVDLITLPVTKNEDTTYYKTKFKSVKEEKENGIA